MRLVLLALDGIQVPSSSDRPEQFRCGSYGKSPHFRLEDAVEGGGEAAGLLLDLPVSCGSESVLRGELLLHHTEGSECWTPPR